MLTIGFSFGEIPVVVVADIYSPFVEKILGCVHLNEPILCSVQTENALVDCVGDGVNILSLDIKVG
jgi:hypothetical protein